MRNLLIAAALLLVVPPFAHGQKDQFPLTAKVTSSDTESAPTHTSTSQTTAMPGTVWQHPQQRTTIHYANSITVTAEIENKVYKLSSPRLLDPGDYPASIDRSVVRISLQEKNGKMKTLKLFIVGVTAKQ